MKEIVLEKALTLLQKVKVQNPGFDINKNQNFWNVQS